MNGLRSSNIIELRASDIHDAEIAVEYPRNMTFTNSKYKRPTIYQEKVIVLPKRLFNHLQCHAAELRTHLNLLSDTYLLVSIEPWLNQERTLKI